MKGQGISSDRLSNNRFAPNMAYIIIPDGVSRQNYIDTCYRTEKVSVQLEGGAGVIHRCYITKEALMDIQFPDISITEKNDTEGSFLGSAVVVVTEPYHDQTIILGVVSKGNESNYFEEELFKVLKTKDGNYVIITGDGKKGSLNVDIIGSGDNGKLNINLRNTNESTQCNVNVKGTINIESSNDINIKSGNSINIQSEKDTAIDKIKVGDADHPLTFGDILKEQLETLQNDKVNVIIDAINNAAVTAGDGGAVFKTNILAYINTNKQDANFDNINSENNFID